MAKFVIEGSRVDIRAAWEKPLEIAPCVLPGLHRGLIGGLYADSDVGKTWMLLQIAVQVAATASVNLLNFETIHDGKVLYISGEDPKAQIHNRINGMVAPLRGRLDGDQIRDQIDKNLVLVSMEGGNLDIMDPEFFSDLAAAGAGYELIILDTLRKFHQRNEDKNSEMIPVMGQLNRLALATGAAVLFAHHVTKSSQRDGASDQTNAHSGAGAIRSESKFGANLSIMTEADAKIFSKEYGKTIQKDSFSQFVKYTTTKGNYGRKPAPSWFKRAENGVLLPIELGNAGIASIENKTNVVKLAPKKEIKYEEI